MQILQSYSQQYAGDSFNVLLKFKMAATEQFHFFSRSQKLANYYNFAITFPTIWRCACDFFEVLPKFEMAVMHELHIFLWAKNLNN